MFRLRSGPLRAAIVLAVGFVLLRVVYRMAFGGVGGGVGGGIGGEGGSVLIDLPLVRLGGPFSHVTLFGPITAVGLGNAALSALPVAAVILVFGALNAVIDVTRLFARGAGRGPLRAISRALAIAWATFPALLDSVRRVRIARRLRGERGVAALLVPVFEQTIERALALAASMETRGLAAGPALAGAALTGPALAGAALTGTALTGTALAGTALAGTASPSATMTDVSLDFDGPWRLEGLSIALVPGTLTVIAGPTGSGKSSLLHSLSGLFQHFSEGRQGGLIEVSGVDRARTPPRDTAAFVGVVNQNVRLGFAAETVHDEIGFALSVRGVAAALVHEQVLTVSARLDINHLLTRPIEALSAGEATLVAIASALIARPALLLVDEPLADLDDAARVRVCTVLDDLAHGLASSPASSPASSVLPQAPICVVVAEHNTAEFARAADAWLEIQGSRVFLRAAHDRPAPPPVSPAPQFPQPSSELMPTAHAGSAAAAAEPLADIRHLTVLHRDLAPGTTPVVDDVSLSIRRGAIVALRGPNGAGKSSLLQAIALPSGPGSVMIAGHDVHAAKHRARRHLVALIPENFDDLLFATSVSEECRRADRTRRAPTPTAQIFVRLLGRSAGPAKDAWLAQHPRDLSAGERLCLVIAIQLSAAPALLLIDEPTRGLDTQARALVGAALARAATGVGAVMFATHDRDFAQRLATTTIQMSDARLLPALVPQ